MTNLHVRTSTATDDGATLFVALELSKARWLVGIFDPAGDRLSRHAVAGGDVAGLLELIAAKRARLARSCGRAGRVLCCYEAGRDGFWLQRRLEQAGIVSHIVDPASIEVPRRRRRAKSDRLDVDKLVRVLRAHARGEAGVCRMVRVPTPEVEDAQRPVRERARLVAERTAHRNRIRGLLDGQGIRAVALDRAGWAERLAGLRTGDGRALPPALAAELRREAERLALVERQLAAVEAELKAGAHAASPAQAARERNLRRLNGVGTAGSALLSREVFWRDFDNRRQVGGFSGFAGSPWRSGDSSREQGISKAGPPRVRAMLIQLAWLWLRHQPDSALSQWFRRRTRNAGARQRRVMIVALARKLLVALWRYVGTGLVPEGARLAPRAA